MAYLELDQLVVGTAYTCVPYISLSDRLPMRYVGDGWFVDADGGLRTVRGDIRYVLPYDDATE